MPAESLGVVVAHDDRAVIEQIAGVLEAIPDLFVAATSIEAARPGNVVVAGGEMLFTARHVPHPLVAVAFDDPVRTARAALASRSSTSAIMSITDLPASPGTAVEPMWNRCRSGISSSRRRRSAS